MRVLYIVSDFNLIGGKERYDRAWLQVLEECPDHEIRVVKLKDHNPFSKLLFAAEVALETVVFRPSVILCAHAHFSPLCFALKAVFETNYVVFVHGVEAWNVRNKLIAHALRGAAKVISVSSFTKEKLEAAIPALKGRVEVIPNSVNEKQFILKRKPKHLVEKHALHGKKVILTVSRLYTSEKGKGIDTMIRALPAVKEKVPNVKYLIVGKGSTLPQFGDDRARLRMISEKCGVSEDVLMVGRVFDLELVDYYNACDAFVLPAQEEGFGIVFLEALACGKPVVAGDKDGSREAVLDGSLGTLVNPGDTEEVARAVIQVLQGKIRRKLLSRAFLRRETLRVYGFDTFREKALNIVNGLGG